jgi:hypothetical protein
MSMNYNSFGDGLMKGFMFVENIQRNRWMQQRTAQLDAENAKQRDFQNQMSTDYFKLQERNQQINEQRLTEEQRDREVARGAEVNRVRSTELLAKAAATGGVDSLSQEEQAELQTLAAYNPAVVPYLDTQANRKSLMSALATFDSEITAQRTQANEAALAAASSLPGTQAPSPTPPSNMVTPFEATKATPPSALDSIPEAGAAIIADSELQELLGGGFDVSSLQQAGSDALPGYIRGLSAMGSRAAPSSRVLPADLARQVVGLRSIESPVARQAAVDSINTQLERYTGESGREALEADIKAGVERRELKNMYSSYGAVPPKTGIGKTAASTRAKLTGSSMAPHEYSSQLVRRILDDPKGAFTDYMTVRDEIPAAAREALDRDLVPAAQMVRQEAINDLKQATDPTTGRLDMDNPVVQQASQQVQRANTYLASAAGSYDPVKAAELATGTQLQFSNPEHFAAFDAAVVNGPMSPYAMPAATARRVTSQLVNAQPGSTPSPRLLAASRELVMRGLLPVEAYVNLVSTGSLSGPQKNEIKALRVGKDGAMLYDQQGNFSIAVAPSDTPESRARLTATKGAFSSAALKTMQDMFHTHAGDPKLGDEQFRMFLDQLGRNAGPLWDAGYSVNSISNMSESDLAALINRFIDWQQFRPIFEEQRDGFSGIVKRNFPKLLGGSTEDFGAEFGQAQGTGFMDFDQRGADALGKSVTPLRQREVTPEQVSALISDLRSGINPVTGQPESDPPLQLKFRNLASVFENDPGEAVKVIRRQYINFD